MQAHLHHPHPPALTTHWTPLRADDVPACGARALRAGPRVFALLPDA